MAKRKLRDILEENEEEIKSGLRIAAQAVKAAYDVHQAVKRDEEKAAEEMPASESGAERDTGRAAKELKEEEDDLARAEKALENGLESLGRLVEMLGEEESSVDTDIEELKGIQDRLRNRDSIRREDVGKIVSVAKEAYSMIDDEINVEARLSHYFVQYATELGRVAEGEQAAHQDLERAEEETEAEAQRTGHRDRIKSLLSFENKEEEEFKQEVQELKQEFREEEQELEILQEEINHTKEEVETLMKEISGIENYLADLGYGDAASTLEEIREGLKQDREKLAEAEEELEEAEEAMQGAESEATSI